MKGVMIFVRCECFLLRSQDGRSGVCAQNYMNLVLDCKLDMLVYCSMSQYTMAIIKLIKIVVTCLITKCRRW